MKKVFKAVPPDKRLSKYSKEECEELYRRFLKRLGKNAVDEDNVSIPIKKK